MFRGLKKHFQRSLAFLLCLWLSGALCALNCNFTPSAQAASVNEAASEVANEDLPPCHRQADKQEEDKTNETSFQKYRASSVMSGCCPLFQANAQPSKTVQLPHAVIAASRFETPASVLITPGQVFQISYKPPPKTRGDTYLKNRALLI